MKKIIIRSSFFAIFLLINFNAGYSNAQTLPNITIQTPKKSETPPTEQSAVSTTTTITLVKAKPKLAEPPRINVGSPVSEEIKAPPQIQPPSKVTQDFYNAFKSGNAEFAEILLQNGADINCKNCGPTPLLHLSIGYGAPPVKNANQWLIAHGANINLQDKNGDTILNHLIFHTFNTSKYQSNLATELIPRFKYLLSNGSDPTIANYEGVTPLHYLANFIHESSAGDSQRTNFAEYTINLLVNAGAQVNSLTINGSSVLLYGMTPKMGSDKACNKLLVEHLISLGADIKLMNTKGFTPYSMAYELAVSGTKACNGLLGILNPDMKPPIINKPITEAPTINLPVSANTLHPIVPVPPNVAGDYSGVLHFTRPEGISSGMSGTISADGTVNINSPFNVKTTGYVTKFDNNIMHLRLKSRPPQGMKFNTALEYEEYEVAGSIKNGIFYSRFNMGEGKRVFILCQAAVVNSNIECRPTVVETFGSAVGGFLGAIGLLPPLKDVK